MCPGAIEKGGLDSHFDTLDVGTKHVPFQLEPNGGGAVKADRHSTANRASNRSAPHFVRPERSRRALLSGAKSASPAAQLETRRVTRFNPSTSLRVNGDRHVLSPSRNAPSALGFANDIIALGLECLFATNTAIPFPFAQGGRRFTTISAHYLMRLSAPGFCRPLVANGSGGSDLFNQRRAFRAGPGRPRESSGSPPHAAGRPAPRPTGRSTRWSHRQCAGPACRTRSSSAG